MEKRYSISDASRQVEVENHVLRYWEEELGLPIERNTKGHRFYKESDIVTLKTVKDLKEQGFQLRAIKLLMPDIGRVRRMQPQELYKLREELNQRVQNEEERKEENTVVDIHMAKRNGTPTRKSNEEKMKQFEKMLRHMITHIMEENKKESEERICEAVSTRLLKEMDYVMRKREENQDKQIKLLQEILNQVRHELPEAAASDESALDNTKKKKGFFKHKSRE